MTNEYDDGVGSQQIIGMQKKIIYLQYNESTLILTHTNADR